MSDTRADEAFQWLKTHGFDLDRPQGQQVVDFPSRAKIVGAMLTILDPVLRGEELLAQMRDQHDSEQEGELELLRLVATKARGLVRTAHVPTGHGEEIQVVSQWWAGLVDALKDLDGGAKR